MKNKDAINPYVVDYLLEKCSAHEIASIIDQCTRKYSLKEINFLIKKLDFVFNKTPSDGRKVLLIVLRLLVHKRDSLSIPIKMHDIENYLTIKGIDELLSDKAISGKIRNVAECELYDISFIDYALNYEKESKKSSKIDEKVSFCIGDIQSTVELISGEYFYSKIAITKPLFKFKMWLSSLFIIVRSDVRKTVNY